ALGRLGARGVPALARAALRRRRRPERRLGPRLLVESARPLRAGRSTGADDGVPEPSPVRRLPPLPLRSRPRDPGAEALAYRRPLHGVARTTERPVLAARSRCAA